MKKRNIDLTQGTIWKVIVAFAIPVFIGQLFQTLYHSVDSIVVGRFVSGDALGAVNSSSTISNTLVGFFTGLSVGVGVVFAKSFGAKEYNKLHDAIQTTITFSLAFGILIAVLGAIFSERMLILLDVDPEILQASTNYLRIYMFGVFFTAVYNVGASVVRSVGDSQSPFIYLLISSITNIVLDLLFVGVFKWGVNGVGIATVIAQFISVVLVFRRMSQLDERYAFKYNELKIKWGILAEVLALGLPAALQQSITSIGNLFTNRYINGFGKSATAGIGTGIKIDQFAQAVTQAIAQTIPTFIAQNIGAKQYKRAHDGIFIAATIAIVSCIVPAVGIYIYAGKLALIFTSEQAIIDVIVAFLHTIMPLYFVMGIHQTFSGILRGFMKAKQAMIINILGMVGVRQTYLALALKANHSLQTLLWNYPIAWGSTAIMLVTYYLVVLRKEIKQLTVEQ